MPDERQIEIEESPAATKTDTLVPMRGFGSGSAGAQRRPVAPVDPPPGNEAAVLPLPVATPTPDR